MADIHWEDRGKLGDWLLKMIAFDNNGFIWGVSTAGNLGLWDSGAKRWIDQKGGWTLKMVTWVGHELYGLGTAGNVGKWNGSGWVDQGKPGNWMLKMLAVTSQGAPWFVGTESNVGRAEGDVRQTGLAGIGALKLVPERSDRPGFPDDSLVDWVAFQPAGASGAADKIYCVGTAHNLGTYDPVANIIRNVDQGWLLKMITFDQQGNLWCVGTAGNVGFCSAAAIRQSAVPSQALRFESFSARVGGGGGKPFQDPEEIVSAGPISRIEIRSGEYIDAIRLHYGRGNNRRSGYWHGGGGGGLRAWDVPEGEEVVRVKGAAGQFVDSLQFITNKGTRSPGWGGGGGAPFVFDEPSGRPLQRMIGYCYDLVESLSFGFGPAVQVPSLEQINQLIQKFGPRMKLHPAENYRMDDPEAVLNSGRIKLQWGLVHNESDYENFRQEGVEATAVVSAASLPEAIRQANMDPQANAPDFKYWLRIDDSLTPGNQSRARALVCVRTQPAFLDLQFWFFYPYNGPGKFRITVGNLHTKHVEMDTCGRHYGDWEHVTLRFVAALKPGSEPWRLFDVYLSRHDISQWVQNLSSLTFNGQHPVVYIARDSHAHYATADSQYYKRPKSVSLGLGTFAVDLEDVTGDGGQEFDTSSPNNYRIVASTETALQVQEPAWWRFNGRWGQYEKLAFTQGYDFRVYSYDHTYKEIGSGPHGPAESEDKKSGIEWLDQRYMGGWHLKMIAFDQNNCLCGVSADGNFGQWDAAGNRWIDKGGGWELRMILSVGNDLYGVGRNFNVGKWNGSGWTDLGHPGGWYMFMLAVNSQGNPWCLGIKEGEERLFVGKAETDVRTRGLTGFGEWKRVPENSRNPGGWTLKWIAFKPAETPGSKDQIYCVGTKHNLGIYDPVTDTMSPQAHDWELDMVTFDKEGNLWCVSTDNNVGLYPARKESAKAAG